ncbi:MAG: FAD-binding protein [Deltaproteobacteria bacterium]|nr:FAD-binding protein [Deltaproteobacteria bacterium]
MMHYSSETYSTDILIIGSAGAGLRAAIGAVWSARVTILSKGPFGRGGATVMAGADIMLDGKSLSEMGFAGNPSDSRERFFHDIVVEGFELNNQKMVQIYVDEAPNRVRELLEWGMKIDPERAFSRGVITSGAEILRVLRKRAVKGKVEFFEFTMATDLLIEDGRVCGAVGVNVRDGRIIFFKARAVILATGGWHELFAFNTGSDDLTGDGAAMAYRAGARLTNMEMVTFCPNIIIHPPAYRATVLLYNFFTGKLYNAQGNEFLLWQDPEILHIAQTSEWNKLIFSRAIWMEIKAGRGSPHGGVYYSLHHIPEVLWKRMERMARWKRGWKFQGKDFTPIIETLRRGDAVEVAPAAHYFEGGLKVMPNAETGVPGLFAAGECSGELFGANRVAAATTEMLVQGALAARSAVDYIHREQTPEPSIRQKRFLEKELTAPLGRQSSIASTEIKQEVQKVAYRTLGPIRHGMELETLKNRIKSWREELRRIGAPKRRMHNRAWIEAMEVRNLLDLIEALCTSALARKESRGVHSRSDFPEMDNRNWLRNVLVQKDGETAVVSTEPILTTSITPEPVKLNFNDALRRAILMEGES